MKKYIILIACSLFWIACERDIFDKDYRAVLEKNSFSEGIYMGYFVLQDQETGVKSNSELIITKNGHPEEQLFKKK